MALVDDLLANPGEYIGTGWFAPSKRPPRVSRLMVTPLPGASGVMLEYDVLSMQGELQHRERSMFARSSDGGSILVVAYAGADSVSVMHEIEPGLFAQRHDGPRPKDQIGIRIDLPEPGRVRHAYCWTDGEGRFDEVDVSELRIVG